MTMRLSSIEFGAVLLSLLLACIVIFIGPMKSIAVPTLALASLVMVVWIVWRDAADFIIPDGPLICLASVATAARLLTTPGDLGSTISNILLDVILCGGALWLVREIFFRLRGYDGMGFGDVKLAAAGGMLVGYLSFTWAVLLASVLGLLTVGIMRLVAPQKQIERLPFGALLAPACWLLWIFNAGAVS